MEFIYSDAFSPWPNKNPSKYIKWEVKGAAVMRTGSSLQLGVKEWNQMVVGSTGSMLPHVCDVRSCAEVKICTAFIGIILLPTFSYSFCLGLIHACRDVSLENILPELSIYGIAWGKFLGAALPWGGFATSAGFQKSDLKCLLTLKCPVTLIMKAFIPVTAQFRQAQKLNHISGSGMVSLWFQESCFAAVCLLWGMESSDAYQLHKDFVIINILRWKATWFCNRILAYVSADWRREQ